MYSIILSCTDNVICYLVDITVVNYNMCIHYLVINEFLLIFTAE